MISLARECVEGLEHDDLRAYLDSLPALARWNVTEQISHIEVPTLVIAADDDYASVSASETYVAKMQHAELVVISESRHATPVEQPAMCNEAVAAFLAQQGSRESAVQRRICGMDDLRHELHGFSKACFMYCWVDNPATW